MNRTLRKLLAACAAVVLAAGTALATDGTWSIASGAGNYDATNGWSGGVIADGVGATLNISGAGGSLYLNTNVTLGAILYNAAFQQKLNFASPKDPIQWPQPFFLTLDAGAPDTLAQIWHQLDYLSSGTPRQILDYPIVLKSDLFFRSSFTNKWEDNDGPAFSVHGDISEGVAGRSLIVSNDHPNMQMTLFGSNSFSGPVRVQQGVLRIADRYQASGMFSQLGAGTDVFVSGNTATLDLNGLSVGPEKTLYLGGAGGCGMGALANSCQVPFHTSVWHGAVSLVSTATLGKGVGGGQFWPSAYGGPLEIAGDITDNGNGFGLIKTSSNPVYLRGNNTYGGGTTITEGYLVATNAANLGTGPLIFNGGTFGFGAPFDLSSVTLSNINSKVMILDTDGYDVTLANPITSLVVSGLTKSGAGTLTLSAANSYKGVTTVNRGTLVLDYSAQLNSKADTAQSMTMAGGFLAVSGGSGFTQTVGRLTVSVGASVVSNLNPLGGTILNFGSTLSRSVGATVTFGTAGAPMTLSPGVNNGLYGGFATFGDSTWATKNATNYNFQFITEYTDYSAMWAASSNVDVTVSNVGGIGSDAQANSLRFNDTDSAGLPVTVTLTGTNILTSGGILVTPAMGANPVVIQGGTLTSKNGQNDLIVFQNNTNAPLVITSSITNNGASTTALTKSGLGTLVVSNTASLFRGNVYVNGGALEMYSAMDLGDTNASKTVYLNDGSTLRLFGSYDLGSAAQVCNITAGAGDTAIDIPNAGDTVTLTGTFSISGRLSKRGKGTLKLAKSCAGTQAMADTFYTLVVEEGTLEMVGNTEFFGKPGVLVVRNGATLKGNRFFAPRSFGRADYQDRFVLRVEGDGAVMDLNGVSSSAGYGTIPLGEPAILPNDYFEGDGRLVLTNSSATTARYTLTRGTHARFTGIFEVPGDYLTSGSTAVFALPNGELRLGSGAVAKFDGITDFCKFGALSGNGYFGGWGDQVRPPFFVGDDRSETFDFSGFLIAYFSGAGWGDTPATGCRFIKTGSCTWRISGTTNDIRQAFTVRKGTVLTGADSTGVNLGVLGKGPVWLGDAGTMENESLALLTDGPYMIGNRIEIKTTAPGVTIKLGGNQTAGASAFTNALALTRDVVLTAANTDSPNGVTFSGKITGTGGITKTGLGKVYLTGIVSNAGPTVVQAGELVIQSSVSLTNTLTVAAGAGGSGTLVVQGDLVLSAGAQLAVSAGTLALGQTYTLVTWTGTRSGTFSQVTGLPTDWHVGYRSNSVVMYYAPAGTLLRVL